MNERAVIGLGYDGVACQARCLHNSLCDAPQMRMRMDKDDQISTQTDPARPSTHSQQSDDAPSADIENSTNTSPATKTKTEVGGPKGLDPTRYGDWERNGRCYDF